MQNNEGVNGSRSTGCKIMRVIMVVTVAVIMVIKLTTARIEQRFCLSCWSSWSWSSRDMIQVLSGSDIIVAVPGGVRA